jgi:hypothetical protein
VLVCAADDVDGLLGTAGTKLNGHREVLSAGGLGDGITTLDTWKVDVAGLDDALLTLGGLDDLLGKAVYGQLMKLCVHRRDVPVTGVGHGESGRASTLLGLDDFVTTELDALYESI